jgi:hypothetical protein
LSIFTLNSFISLLRVIFVLHSETLSQQKKKKRRRKRKRKEEGGGEEGEITSNTAGGN